MAPFSVALITAQIRHILSNHDNGIGDDIELPELTTATGIGITVAISGNVLISLALNLQKLAHRRVESARAKARSQNGQPKTNGSGNLSQAMTLDEVTRERGFDSDIFDEDEDQQRTRPFDEPEDIFGGDPLKPSVSTSRDHLETQRLLIRADESPRNYGVGPNSSRSGGGRQQLPKPTFISRLFSLRFRLKRPVDNEQCVGDNGIEDSFHSLHPVDEVMPSAFPIGKPTNDKIKTGDGKMGELGNESDYLKSKIWWLGFFLMNVGELGNFISYAFAPASVVAPLGTFALIANCLFAPLMQGERFRKMDLVGIFIAVVGAITVVLSSNTSDERLDRDALIHAISQQSFILFSCVYIAGAIVLAALSEAGIGRNWVFVDVGLCSLFGGFTVLSTKAVSTLLTLEWLEMFTEWITYPIVLILVATGVGQIRYLNRALMRFDSKVVIPSQFVLFTLSAIIGSAVLYGDFAKATFHQLLTFFYGCTATFLGVFIIAWAPAGEDEIEDVQEDTGETSSSGFGSEGPRTAVDRLGTFGRRNRNRILSPNMPRDAQTVKRRKSIVSIGVSPAQHILLVHSPPRDVPERRFHGEDVERDQVATPDSFRRRRAISWFGEGVRECETRDSSVGTRDRNGTIPQGSM